MCESSESESQSDHESDAARQIEQNSVPQKRRFLPEKRDLHASVEGCGRGCDSAPVRGEALLVSAGRVCHVLSRCRPRASCSPRAPEAGTSSCGWLRPAGRGAERRGYAIYAIYGG